MRENRNMPAFRKAYSVFFSLRNVLVFTYIVLSVLIIAVFSGITIRVSEKIITEKENRAVLSSLQNIADRIDLKIDEYANQMIALAYEASVQTLLKSNALTDLGRFELINGLYAKLFDMNVTHSEIQSIVIMDRNGTKYTVANQNNSLEEMLKHYYGSPLSERVDEREGGLYIDFSGIYSGDRNHILLIRTINELRGKEALGLIAVSIKKEALENILFQDPALRLNRLIDSNGLVASDAHKQLRGSINDINIQSHMQSGPSFAAELDGESFFITYLQNKRYPYTIINRVPEHLIYKDVAYIKKTILYLILFMLCAVATIAFFLSKSLVRPIGRLIRLMSRVRRGDLNVKMERMPHNEIGILADNFNQMVDTLRNSIPMRKERLIGKLLLGRVASEEYRLQAAELGLPGEEMAGCAIVIERYERGGEALAAVSVDEMEMFLQEWLTAAGSAALLYVLDNRRIVAIVQDAEAGLIVRLHEALHEERGIWSAIGVGRSYRAYEKLHDSYNEALEALRYKHLFGANEIIYISDIQVKDYNYEQLDAMEDEIVQAVKYMQEKELLASMDALFTLFKEQFVSRETMVRTITNIYFKLLRLMSGLRIDLLGSDRSVAPVPSLEKVTRPEHTQELRREFGAFLQAAASLIGSEQEKQMNATITKAIRIIRERYSDSELSVGSICKELFISENYFSKLFKQETGKNFSQYVSSLRLEEAKALLQQTDLKINEIAAQVGFNDANYFSLCFKGAYGVSPGKFRG
ncbi:helix-turn-helix domain-containing protein [Paenibacillus sp. MBLB4367]|uniref:helix-turn-helix domain-containing protein n=1 Tax=Paenibacillus sp. MBLB4367 TaxID=3384767 RepID=UPI003908272E